jgi:hypothetical protein
VFGQRVDKAISANSAKERSFLQPIRLSHYHLALLIALGSLYHKRPNVARRSSNQRLDGFTKAKFVSVDETHNGSLQRLIRIKTMAPV